MSDLVQQCSIGGCEKPILNLKRGLCGKHYARFLKHGDPMATGRPDLGLSLEERFWSKVDRNGPIPENRPKLGPCWLWTRGVDNNGYGQFVIMGERRGYPRKAYRVAYELLIGPVPEGLELDHLCRNRPCVNPSHLEPVTHPENLRRGRWAASINARKTECIRGHAFNEANTYHRPGGGRDCRPCARLRERQRAVAARPTAAAPDLPA